MMTWTQEEKPKEPQAGQDGSNKQASDEDKEIMHEVCYYSVTTKFVRDLRIRIGGWGGHDLWHENTQWTSEMMFSAHLLQVIFFAYYQFFTWLKLEGSRMQLETGNNGHQGCFSAGALGGAPEIEDRAQELTLPATWSKGLV